MTRSTNGNTIEVTADGVELSGFQLGTAGSGAGHGIQCTGADFLRVHNLWVLNTRGDGINILRGSNCQIRNNHFEDTGETGAGEGIHIIGTAGASSNNVICDNHLSNVAGDGILIEQGTTNDTEICRNTIHNATGWGINIGASSTDAQVFDNVMGNNTSGNIQDNGTTSIILNNYDVVDGVWDEILTAATHNIATSAGRRLRDISSNVIITGDVVSSTANATTFDATFSDDDGSYDPAQVIITEGTGSGQVRGILEYFGSAGGNGNPGRTAIVDRDWKTTPDATSKVSIIAQDGRISTNEGQLRAATSTTMQLNSLAPAGDDVLNGQTIQLRSGTGQDQAALINDYDGGTQTITVSALAVTPDATTAYQIIPVGMAIVEEMETAALTQFVTDDTGEVGAAAGSVAKLSQSSATSLAITPLTVTVDTGLVSETHTSVFQHSGPTQTFIITDSEGDPVDVSTESFIFKVYEHPEQTGDTIFTRASTDGQITVGGASSNQVAVTYSSTGTANDGGFRYVLRNTATEALVRARGNFNIEQMPTST
jgi:hypothetical protein